MNLLKPHLAMLHPAKIYPLKRRKSYSKLQFVPSVLIRPTAVHSLSRPWSTFSPLASLMDSGRDFSLSSPWRTFCCPAGHVLPSSKHNSLYIITTLIQNGEDCLLNFRITCWSDYTFEKWSTTVADWPPGAPGVFPVGRCTMWAGVLTICATRSDCATSHLKG